MRNNPYVTVPATPVLNAGSVKLIDFMGCDDDIIHAAYMSTKPDDHICMSSNEKATFINRLYANHHMSPFEMLETKFRITAPIFIARQ